MTFSPSAKPDARAKAVAGLIAEIKADTRPILLGPWRSEVGFEVLYWIPFLRHLASQIPNFDKRAAIVTRGGLAPLYAQIASQGYDLYALRTLEDVRRENLFDAQIRQKGKTQKQLEPTEWDDVVLEHAADALGLGSVYHTVHPAWMYWALGPFWEEQAGLRYLTSLTKYGPLPKVALQSDLPAGYVAMKWYGRHTFPYPHPQIAEFVQEIVARVAAQVPVVLLQAGGAYDDHLDIPVVGPNVHLLPPDLRPEDNLKVQAAVIGGAKAFIGTYGGVAQLALSLGIPSLSFYGEFGGTAHAHLALSSWLATQMKVPWGVASLAEVGLWKSVFGAAPKAAAMMAAAA